MKFLMIYTLKNFAKPELTKTGQDTKTEIEPTLKKLEKISKVIVLGLPNGKYEQGPEYGNPFEEHLSTIYFSFLENLGYKTDVLGEPDKEGSNITAWKFLNN